MVTVGCKPKISIFHFIGTHKEYDVIIKNQKNCKHITHDYKEAKNMPCYEIENIKKLTNLGYFLTIIYSEKSYKNQMGTELGTEYI